MDIIIHFRKYQVCVKNAVLRKSGSSLVSPNSLYYKSNYAAKSETKKSKYTLNNSVEQLLIFFSRSEIDYFFIEKWTHNCLFAILLDLDLFISKLFLLPPPL